MHPIFQNTGIVGTGAMGRGIAQMAAQAGSQVWLFDVQAGAAQAARDALHATWQTLVTKNKMSAEQMRACVDRLRLANALSDLTPCDLVIEAIVERLDVKQRLFAELEGIVGADTVLATNTSSLSVTAIAAPLKRPAQLAGFHFFNPVPLMRVVEVIAGLKTSARVCQQLTDFTRQFGHTPVTAQDTPGFIVNHAGQRCADQRQRSQQGRDPGDGHVFAQAAHIADVLVMVHADDDRTRRHEQQRLEEGMRHQVEHRDRIRRSAECHRHVAELRPG